MDAGPGGGSDAARRFYWGTGAFVPSNGLCGTSCDGWGKVGRGLAAVLTRRSSSDYVLFEAGLLQSQIESLCSLMPPGLGCHHVEFCQGDRHFVQPEDRSYSKESSKEFRRGEDGPTKEAATEVCQEAKEAGRSGLLSRNGPSKKGVFQGRLNSKHGHDPSGTFEQPSVPGLDPARDAFNEKSSSSRGPSTSSPTWERLQTFSTTSWCSTLVRRVISSRTPFAEFLKISLQAVRSPQVAPAKTLFPLPSPGVVLPAQKRSGARERRRKAFNLAFHTVVMALNYWHADFKFLPLSSISCSPSEAQSTALANIRKFLKIFGSFQENISIPASGRRSTTLISLLADLSDFLTWQGLAGDSYMRGFPGAAGGLQEVIDVPTDLTKAPELVPYRQLQPDRLKISGTASWDPSDFLSDALWMAFQEPASLLWTSELPPQDFPDLDKEHYDSVLQLAKVWDARGLLKLVRKPSGWHWRDGAMRFFNCYKSVDNDRMIGDRRIRNWQEGTLPGVSRALPNACQFSLLEIDPKKERLSICVSDRRDFYHQFKISDKRSDTNCLWPPLHEKDLAGLSAFEELRSQRSTRPSYDRGVHGDFLGGDRPFSRKDESSQSVLVACFQSIPQGDHLGVEFATDSHRNFLSRGGLLCPSEELRADSVWPGKDLVQGLVIDDYYAVSVEKADGAPDILRKPKAVSCFQRAKGLYKEAGLLGSDDKDVVDAQKAKVTGGELDSSPETRRLGMTTLAAPLKKRLALSFISLELARLPCTTDALHLCLLGGWTHALMYRRPFMSLVEKSYKAVDAGSVSQDHPKLVPMTRGVAEELVLMAVLAPLMVTDLAPEFSEKVYATDASDAKGAFVSAEVSEDIVQALWRTGRKKGGYHRLLTREEALIRKLDPTKEEPIFEHECMNMSPERPRAHRFHFIEICGGSGKVSRAMSNRGWTVGPVLDLDSSHFFDLRGMRSMQWIFHLLESGLLDSFMVEPPCTTLSPAQHPASRGYDCPRGYDPQEPKTFAGTQLGLHAVALIFKAALHGALGLLEQPRKTKMKKLPEWQWLVENGWAHEEWLAACAFGSPHLKEFIFLACGLETAPLHRTCSRDHEHIQIAGKFTKPSAVYPDALAEALATCFEKALLKKLRREKDLEPSVAGLESVLCNDVLLSADWKVEESWSWRKPSHINLQETSSACKLLKRLAIREPCTRQVVIMDSNVGLSALVKGRSPSFGLRRHLRRAGALIVAGCLYPSYHFGPTRWNVADCPTRDLAFPEKSKSALSTYKNFEEYMALASVQPVSRWAANWLRLFTLLRDAPLSWKLPGSAWRFAGVSFKHHPCLWGVQRPHHRQLDYDQTLGYPGEGPLPRTLKFWLLFLDFGGFWILDFSGFWTSSLALTLAWPQHCSSLSQDFSCQFFPGLSVDSKIPQVRSIVRSRWTSFVVGCSSLVPGAVATPSHGPQETEGICRELQDVRARSSRRAGQCLSKLRRSETSS